MNKTPAWILRNVAGRPVEIHGPAGVLVLPPFGELAVDEIDAQCLALERRGVLTRHAAKPAAEPSQAARAARGADAAKAAAGGPGAATGEGTKRKQAARKADVRDGEPE